KALARPTQTSWQIFREKYLPSHAQKRWILILHRPTRTLVDSFLAAGIQIVRIYAPEHGLFGEMPAGASVKDTTYRGIPVLSLYGTRNSLTVEELQHADAVLFALRDVGVRHYTYLTTLSYTLQAAAQAQRPVWVLDFPNPHSHYAYGPILEKRLFSFVGLHPTPLVLGLTIGEYAQLLVGEGWVPPVSLHIVFWEGWRRGEPLPVEAPFFTEPPSPALRSPQAIELYPILGWYEGARWVSVGRGTERPFEQVGVLKKYPLPVRDTLLYGYKLEYVSFTPAGEAQPYHGWRIRRLYNGAVSPDSLFRLGFWLLKTFYHACGDTPEFYQAEFFDKLFGTSALRHKVKEGVESLYHYFKAPPEWQQKLSRYRKYPD
ncbi:MAG: DUF1343 domain-containing protein, partial [Bacteroidia bacterium]|nr:DUF1343 domain-containing protein [Bacteroidia bacterium]MDW8058149.1 DUF1343 domain-containing protein [Bacteroidia bacterium]